MKCKWLSDIGAHFLGILGFRHRFEKDDVKGTFFRYPGDGDEDRGGKGGRIFIQS